MKLLVFVLACVVDWIWSMYIKTTAHGQTLASSIYASLVVLAGAAITIFYVSDHWLVVPAAAGAFVGTWVSHKQVAILKAWNLDEPKSGRSKAPPMK